jgi:hypothetical protein
MRSAVDASSTSSVAALTADMISARKQLPGRQWAFAPDGRPHESYSVNLLGYFRGPAGAKQFAWCFSFLEAADSSGVLL